MNKNLQNKHIHTDLCIVGAGPAGCAAALSFTLEKQKYFNNKEIIIIDKAGAPAEHTLSGAVISTKALDFFEKIASETGMIQEFNQLLIPVKQDWMQFLAPSFGIRVPAALLPKHLQHNKDVIIQTGDFIKLLYKLCEAKGIHIYNGVTASDIIVDDNSVKAIIIPEAGRDKQGKKKNNYKAQETISAERFIFCDGAIGTCTEKLLSIKSLRSKKQPQVYSIGVKQLVILSRKSVLQEGTVIHSLGYPLPVSIFGGGFIYGLENRHAAVGLLIGLDYKYRDLNPVEELERFKQHPQISHFLKDHEVLCSGAKTTPEGGFFSLPEPGYGNTLIAGDAGGFMNLFQFKGFHCAVASGIAAGKAAAKAENKNLVSHYKQLLSKAGTYRELYLGRNFRQLFTSPFGFLFGAPLSILQQHLPKTVLLQKDSHAILRKTFHRKQNDVNREKFVYFSKAYHEENTKSHITIKDTIKCRLCTRKGTAPCLHFCPGKVYSENGNNQPLIQHTNCLHDKTCLVKCPYENIEWVPPFDGGGPRYSGM